MYTAAVLLLTRCLLCCLGKCHFTANHGPVTTARMVHDIPYILHAHLNHPSTPLTPSSLPSPVRPLDPNCDTRCEFPVASHSQPRMFYHESHSCHAHLPPTSHSPPPPPPPPHPPLLSPPALQLRVRPLDPSCDTWCEFPVASRPSAVQQWLDSGDPKGEWVLMIETDYVFIK